MKMITGRVVVVVASQRRSGGLSVISNKAGSGKIRRSLPVASEVEDQEPEVDRGAATFRVARLPGRSPGESKVDAGSRATFDWLQVPKGD